MMFLGSKGPSCQSKGSDESRIDACRKTSAGRNLRIKWANMGDLRYWLLEYHIEACSAAALDNGPESEPRNELPRWHRRALATKTGDLSLWFLLWGNSQACNDQSKEREKKVFDIKIGKWSSSKLYHCSLTWIKYAGCKEVHFPPTSSSAMSFMSF